MTGIMERSAILQEALVFGDLNDFAWRKATPRIPTAMWNFYPLD
jgi:hypothetical protein